MGVCDSEPGGCTVVCCLDKGNRVVCEWLQCTEPCQHYMGILDGEPVRCAAVCNVGMGDREAH